MKRLMNFLRGVAVLTVTGPFPERVVNLCAQERLEFWGVEWLDSHTLRLAVRRSCLRRLGELAERVDCEVQVDGRRGLPEFLLRFRTRYAFLVGLSLSLCAVAFLSRFVLTIEVTGNEQVPTAVILSQLRQSGVRPGVYGPAIDRQQVAQEALLGLEELSWMGINLHGTRLEVIVRERVKSPERIDESGWYDVVAEADGIVTHVEAELGDAVVAEGDTVLAGEVLISGTVTMEPPKYSDLPNRYYQTHARGRVWARTWRTLEAAIPIAAQVKEYTGEESHVWALEAAGKRVELWGEESPDGEKERQVWQPVLPGGVELPICLVRETFRPYAPKAVQVDLSAAQELLEGQLEERVRALIGEEGTLEGMEYTARVEGELLVVKAVAECTEEIGLERPGQSLQPEEGRAEGAVS